MTTATPARVAAIDLGYELETGAPVSIPIKHTCITGQSQEAGKTTALEAMVERSGRRAVTFITKRGEGSFRSGRPLAPYFRERADWQFVASLIDATLNEKNKILRSWLMKVCRNTKTLREVQANVRAAKAEARGFSESIYTEIEGYLELVVPHLALLPPPAPLALGPGVNVMDLSSYPVALQGLVIPSVLEYVYEKENEVITVIPEAWEFLPEGRGSPVKLAARTLLRKGAAIKNYLWIDSQDLGGVDKEIVRGCPVLMIGVQREANEIRRTLGNIPSSVPRLTPADLSALRLGQFIVCYGQSAIKTYVRPLWARPEVARLAAQTGIIVGRPELGLEPARTLEEALEDGRKQAERENPRAGGLIPDPTWRLRELEAESLKRSEELARLGRRLEELEGLHQEERKARLDAEARAASLLRENRALGERLEVLEKVADQVAEDVHERVEGAGIAAPRGILSASAGDPKVAAAASDHPEELYQYIRTRLLEESPALLKVLEARPEIIVEIRPIEIALDGATLRGRVARLLARSWFTGDARRTNAVRSELARTGADPGGGGTLKATLDDFVKDGFLVREGEAYRAAPAVKVTERYLALGRE